MLETRDGIVLPAAAAGVAVSVAPARGIFGIAAYRDKTAALAATLGVALPATPRQIDANGITWLWSGVTSWLALSRDQALPAPLETIGALAAVTDQSHGRTILHVTGGNAAEALAKLVPIDLHPAGFAPDATALTLAGPIGVQIWRIEQGFALACFSSYGQALADALAEAARPFGEGMTDV